MSHAATKCRRCQRSRSRSRMQRLSDIMPHTLQAAIQQYTLPFPMDRLAQGYDGFEELRKYIKHGSEFSKEVAIILQERAEVEHAYSKSLNKLAQKLLKAVTTSVGSLADGWKAVGVAMEQESELHKNLAAGMLEEMSKPLKGLVETQVKARKPIEVTVDKSYKTLQDKRAEEFKSKKHSYSCCKDHEKAEDGIAAGKAKDNTKLQKRSRQLQAASKKADKEYTENSYKAETARQDWEMTAAKASSQLQQLEEERMKNMQDFLNKYNSHVSVLAPKLTQIHACLNEAVISVDLRQDIHTVTQQKGVQGPRQPEQLLIDCYAEDTQVSMNMDRRKESLRNYLIYIHQLIEKERKGKEGVQKLVDVYKNKPTFADPEAQEDTRQRLHQTMLMLNFLEASHFKINKCLCKLEERAPLQHPFDQYLQSTRDKQNFVVSTLKLPLNMALDDTADYSSYSMPNDYYMELATGDGEEEFEDEFETDLPSPIGKCTVLYDYDATEGDELSIKQGDTITIYEKLGNDWWQGELNGRSGIFPSTYVKEL